MNVTFGMRPGVLLPQGTELRAMKWHVSPLQQCESDKFKKTRPQGKCSLICYLLCIVSPCALVLLSLSYLRVMAFILIF